MLKDNTTEAERLIALAKSAPNVFSAYRATVSQKTTTRPSSRYLPRIERKDCSQTGLIYRLIQGKYIEILINKKISLYETTKSIDPEDHNQE